MKKVFYVIGIIIFLVTCYIFVNFFFFDSWACHSSEKQLNNYVKHEDSKKLKEIAKDNKTYQFLKKQNKISIDGKSDNQGSGHIGYYRIDINGKPASLFIKIKHAFLPEIPKVKTVELDK
ncbi:hypothetical protein [Staphylococcus epidermidis]|uniref:hypothetical protein n=1 Tax=Staphylococcus epidermidis TaxID=1282 RepID=UPI001D0D571C|nr:hypothetical protein [Staphylococcus epidermidis]MCC2072405.1 hypothetical protein [Staphylococcus epidermidis]MCG1510429.1 hypothetical protein [Staphylococcus epidermidis]MCO6344479.1 hypothetical protein [Staphylococcus epidermidis]